jgi:hypothetical protein
VSPARPSLLGDVHRNAPLTLSAAILISQVVVAVLSARLGRDAERRGRRPLLPLGFAALPLRGLLLAMLPCDTAKARSRPSLVGATECSDALPPVSVEGMTGINVAAALHRYRWRLRASERR